LPPLPKSRATHLLAALSLLFITLTLLPHTGLLLHLAQGRRFPLTANLRNGPDGCLWIEIIFGDSPSLFRTASYSSLIPGFACTLVPARRGVPAGLVTSLDYWLPALLLTILTLLRLRKRPAFTHPACPTCNYDLRAHAPNQRCPECGAPINSDP
jgi:hypothetical protein